MEYYNFFCIDIVGSSVDVDSQLENIKELLRVIKDFLVNSEKKTTNIIYWRWCNNLVQRRFPITFTIGTKDS